MCCLWVSAWLLLFHDALCARRYHWHTQGHWQFVAYPTAMLDTTCMPQQGILACAGNFAHTASPRWPCCQVCCICRLRCASHWLSYYNSGTRAIFIVPLSCISSRLCCALSILVDLCDTGGMSLDGNVAVSAWSPTFLAMAVLKECLHQLAYLDSVPVEAATAVQAGEARGGALLQMLRNLWLQEDVQASLVDDLAVVARPSSGRKASFLGLPS